MSELVLKPPPWRQLLKPGTKLFFGSGATCPHSLIESMLPFAKEAGDIEILQGLILGKPSWTNAEYQNSIKVNAFYLDSHLSELVNEGVDDYTPAHYSDIPGLIRERIVPIDGVLLSVSTPDKYGYCSLGPSVEWMPEALKVAKWIVAQINPTLPKTYGATQIHLRELTYGIERSESIPTLDLNSDQDEYGRLAEYVSQLVNDGDTLQLGVGPLVHSISKALTNHNNLGIHSELVGDGVMSLFKAGVITNSRKSFLPGKMVVSQAMGSEELYQFIHDNPHFDFRPSDFVSNPINIAKNNRMVSINSALQVDLTGQVVLDSVSGRFRSGVGSIVDFVRGASMSKQGRPIIALPSTSKDSKGKLYSTISASLPAGAGVGCHRSDIHYIVTEWGVAALRGRTIQERVQELIHIAHPDFREGLLREARINNLIPKYFVLPPPSENEKTRVLSRKLKLEDGVNYILRPLDPSDDRRLQEFFYSHSEETVFRRYGFTVTRMSRERAFELVGINQDYDLALALIELRGPQKIIHAVGRYYLDPSTKSAEMAFVVRETKRRLGMAKILLERMIEVAKERKLHYLWAQVDRDNSPMLSLFRKFGCEESVGDDYHTLCAKILITPQDEEAGKRPYLPFRKK